MSKKILMISTIYPYPKEYGKKIVLSGILEYLSSAFGAENITYAVVSNEDGQSRQPVKPVTNIAVKNIGGLRKLWNLGRYVVLTQQKSIQECMLYSPHLQAQLLALVDQVQPDLIFVDTIRIGQFFETEGRPAGRYILYMDDLFSVRYGKMLAALQQYRQVRLNPLGNFGAFVPPYLAKIINIVLVQKMILSLEARLIRKRELACINFFDLNLLISQPETQLLKELTGRTNLATLNPWLNTPERALARKYDGNHDFIFLGALNFTPNETALINFIAAQMEAIIQIMPDFALKIIGRGATPALADLAQAYPAHIKIEGYLDDLDAVLNSACAMIVPLLFGSGVKIKTLEALSRGLPVIASDFGVEGIQVNNGIECIVENDFSRYPQIMHQLTDIGKNQAMSQKAYAYFASHYSKSVIYAQYDQLFGGQ